MADETPFAGLRRLHLGEGLDEEFLYGNGTVIDRLLKVGARTHRHDAHAALVDPADLVPVVETDDVGGTIQAEVGLYVGATFVDADGGETTLSDTTLVTTRDALVAPTTPPTLDAITHAAGTLLANDYTYAATVVDGTGGETPLGPAITVTVDPGNANSQIELSGLTDIVDEVGGTGWRLWRQVAGGRWGLVDDGAGDVLVDDGSFCVNCDVEPPEVGTTAATSRLRVTIPGPAPDGAVTFNVYVSVDGTFSSPCLIGSYPVAELEDEKTYVALDLQDGSPPVVSLSIPGADKIDPDTELVDWHWKRPVATAGDLPVDAEEGDVRIALDDGLPRRYIDGAWDLWNTAGTGVVIQDHDADMTIRNHLNFIGPLVTVDDDAGDDATDVNIALDVFQDKVTLEAGGLAFLGFGLRVHAEDTGSDVVTVSISSPGRADADATAVALDPDDEDDLLLTMYKGYTLYSIATNRPARVRLYVNAAYRAADAARPIGTDPTGDHGLLLEVVTEAGHLTYALAPPVLGFTDETPASDDTACRITNLDGATGDTTVTFTYLPTEV